MDKEICGRKIFAPCGCCGRSDLWVESVLSVHNKLCDHLNISKKAPSPLAVTMASSKSNGNQWWYQGQPPISPYLCKELYHKDTNVGGVRAIFSLDVLIFWGCT